MTVARRLHLDQAPNPKDSRIVAEVVQDVEPILDANKAGLSAHRTEYGRKVASVPVVIIEKWLNEEHARGNTDLKFPSPAFNALVLKKLQSSEWAYLRVE